MAYTTGTASGYLELLDVLLDFLTGTNGDLPSEEQWSVLRDDTLDNEKDREVILEGPGGSSMDPLYVGIRTNADEANDAYNWELAGFTGYDSDSSWDEQPGISTIVGAAFWESDVPYWIVANGRRLILLARVANTYQSVHLGYLLAYGAPGDHSYPLYVAGTLPGNYRLERFDTQPSPSDVTYGDYPNAIFCPSYDQEDDRSSGYFRTNDGSWLKGGNKDSDTVDFGSLNGNFAIFPFQSMNAEPGTWSWLRTGPDGTRTLIPFVLYLPDQWMAGEIQGLYAAYGDKGAKPEDTITISDVDYVLFPDVRNPGIDRYGALRLE